MKEVNKILKQERAKEKLREIENKRDKRLNKVVQIVFMKEYFWRFIILGIICSITFSIWTTYSNWECFLTRFLFGVLIFILIGGIYRFYCDYKIKKKLEEKE